MNIVHATEQEAYIQAAARIAEDIMAILKQQGQCTIGIMGGRAMPGVLERLVAYGSEFHGTLHVFWIDERISPEKNFVAALPFLEQLHKEGVAVHWHPIQSLHRQQSEVEVRQVERALHEAGGRLDIVLASAGEDGHIASLFPQSHTLKARHVGYIFEEHAPKPPALRVTVTPALITGAQAGFLFFIGEKRRAYELFMDRGATIDACPARLLLQVPKLTVFTALR